MSGLTPSQCLLFFVHEKGQDVTAATSSSSIRFYALLPEIFRTEHAEFLKLFTENGITVMSASDGSSLQLAQEDELEIIEILLCVTSAAAVNSVTLVVENGNLHRVRRIFSNSTVDLSSRMKNYCKVEVYPAVDDSNSAIMKCILSQRTNICYKHPSGESLLHLAAKRGHETFTELTLEHGIDVNSKCINGLTPLHVAVNGGYGNVVDVLLQNGANVGSKTNAGLTALRMAAEERLYSIVESLLRHGADAESKTEEGLTELSLAVKNCDTDMVKLLLRNGADPDCRDNNGRTPLFTTEDLRPDIAEVLLSYGARLAVKLTDGRSGINLHHPENFSLCQLLLESSFCDPEILTLWKGVRSVICATGLRHKLLRKPMIPSEPGVLICARHVAKIIAANLYPLKPDLEQICNFQVDFKAECVSEVALMKERTVGDTNLTFFDILTLNVSQVARLLRNSSVAQSLGSSFLHITFPNYAGILKWQFRKGNQRKLAVEEGVKSIDSVCGLFCKVPREVKENIFDYLSVRDILILKHAHAHTDV